MYVYEENFNDIVESVIPANKGWKGIYLEPKCAPAKISEAREREQVMTEMRDLENGNLLGASCAMNAMSQMLAP